MHAEK